jgi:hypothetical protein
LDAARKNPRRGKRHKEEREIKAWEAIDIGEHKNPFMGKR